ncbi:Hsp70 family protein [Clostridiaceae bacterium OttesenSCG-928-D20]|nr:Hsp70 family protein [Clostridiaceae bacterium OttesenSCG-928-D20]
MIIGIDLGTTNSVAAYYDGEKPVLIPNRLGEYLTPSVVSIDTDGTILVGKSAKQRAELTANSSANLFKRSMGTDKAFTLSGKSFSAEELSSFILRSLKQDAEVFLGEEVAEAIISVPAYFNDNQRRATRKAGELAGFRVERIINEPTAAALAFGVGEGKEGRFMVFDLGGGTFDLSILELDDTIMEVQSIAGDNFLGGEDFTDLITSLFLLKSASHLDELTYGELIKLSNTAELAKLALGESHFVMMTSTIGGKEITHTISRMEFEQASIELLTKMQAPIQKALYDAGCTPKDLSKIILVGGATRSPLIRTAAERLLEKTPSAEIDPDLAVALGAAIQCGMKARNEALREVILTDVCPFTLGTSIIRSNGIFDEPNHYFPIIERNTVIPTSREEILYTAHDNQDEIRIDILQGESRVASQNLKLGELNLPVPKGPKGKESVKVRYTYDVNSLLQVEAEIISTGVKKEIILQQGENRFTDEEALRRLERLSYLKISPRDQEENKMTLMRAEKLYEKSTGETRIFVDRLISDFERSLRGQDISEIDEAREVINTALDDIEASME